MSTLGEERLSNPLLAFQDEEKFLQWFPGTFPAVPSYYPRMRPINRAGPRFRRDIPPPPQLTPGEFDVLRQRALVVDVRSLDEYSAGHIPNALSITFRDVYPIWLGWLAPEGANILFVLGDAPVEQVIDQSQLVGYEGFGGWLTGGMDAWAASGRPVRQMQLLDAHQARRALVDGALALDVREPPELESGYIEGAMILPLGNVEAEVNRLPKDRPILAYCGHGERSATALSLLERAGFSQLLNLNGGVGGWSDAGYNLASPAGVQ